MARRNWDKLRRERPLHTVHDPLEPSYWEPLPPDPKPRRKKKSRRLKSSRKVGEHPEKRTFDGLTPAFYRSRRKQQSKPRTSLGRTEKDAGDDGP
jgi:hypothetical protein